MRDAGLLDDHDWCHFLGLGGLEHACVLTTIQECLRDINPRLRVSFDVASPFLSASYGSVLVSCTLGPERWTNQHVALNDLIHVGSNAMLNEELEKAWRTQEFAGDRQDGYATVDDLFEGLGQPEARRFFGSEIGRRVTVGDVCLPADVKDPSTATWDRVSYLVVMNHNVARC
jgi:hypothetical protein